ncbi:MAG: hypothetical protein ABIJ56_14665, partial [Pseudomonadota bacterium]
PTDDGEGVRAIRSCGGGLGLAEIRPVEEGRDIGSSELARLHATPLPLVYDVEVLFGGREKPAQKNSSHGGPPRVSSDAFRKNWESIFGNGPFHAS